MKIYKVEFSGWALVEADSEDEAKDKFFDSEWEYQDLGLDAVMVEEEY